MPLQPNSSGRMPMNGFNTFSGPFTECSLLATVVTLFPHRTLEFHPVVCCIVNHAEADAALRLPYREGWTL